MKRAALVSVILIITILLGCSSKAPATPSPTQETSLPALPQTPEPKPASFSVSGLTITPTEVTSGFSVTIEVLVTNVGELSGTYEVTLKIEDAVEATENVTLAGGGSQKVSFTTRKPAAKTYSVDINGLSGNFVVKVAPPSSVIQPPPPLPPLDAFMKGFNFGDWAPFDKPRPLSVGPLYNPAYDFTLKNLASTGTNWIRLLVNVEQETFASTEVRRSQYGTPTDSALRHVIDHAHSLGIRVGFNINIQFSQDPTHYRPQIGSSFTTEAQWQAWFASYREIVLYYAALAQDTGVDMFAIGYELGATTHREADWRSIAQEVRQVYMGPIIYSASTRTDSPANEELRIKWWDAMDYIGVEPYFPLTDKTNPTVEELKAAWVQKRYVSRFENLSKQFQKPIIITEIGYLAQDGTNMLPSMTAFKARFPDAPLDLQEQADCYQAAFEVFWGRPWLKGIFWWQWLANPVWWPGGPTSKIEDVYGKPAEEVVKKFYLAP